MNPQPVVLASGDTSIYSEALGQCLKTTYQFNGRLFQNICDGTQNFIPNGFWDYAALLAVVGIGIGFCLLLLVFFFKILFD